MKYITFDPYYTVKEQLKFIEQYKNTYGHNYLVNKEYVSTKAPYRHFIEVKDSDLPVFLKYDIASSQEVSYMVRKVVPLYSSEEYKIRRRESDTPSDIGKLINTEALQAVQDSNYALVFRYSTPEQMRKMTRELGITVYDLGKQRSSWNIAIGFDKGIKNYINRDYVLLEKKISTDYRIVGSFEYDLNYKYLIQDKLRNKTFETAKWVSGTYKPLNRSIPS